MSLGVTYLFLLVAIVAEVAATTALARSDSFTKLVPSIITILGYGIAFYCLSYPLRVMPTGVVYAVWSGLGIVLIASIAWIWFGQKLDLATIIGLGFILLGVVIVNLFSKSLPH